MMVTVSEMARKARIAWKFYRTSRCDMPGFARECKGQARAYLEVARNLKGHRSHAQKQVMARKLQEVAHG